MAEIEAFNLLIESLTLFIKVPCPVIIFSTAKLKRWLAHLIKCFPGNDESRRFEEQLSPVIATTLLKDLPKFSKSHSGNA